MHGRLRPYQERQLRGGRAGSYKVELRSPGMGHMSFGDMVLAAPDAGARERALKNLQVTMAVTRAFLNQHLKGAPETVMDAARGTEVIVRKYAP